MKKKKVLLVGEYSGVHRHLKLGLEQLGVDVTLISDGDQWKAIGGNDYPLVYQCTKDDPIWIKVYSYFISPIFYIFRYKLMRYQVVQFMDLLLYYPVQIRKKIFGLYKLFNGKLVICAAGNNFISYDAFLKGAYRYFVYSDLPREVSFPRKDKERKIDYYIAEKADEIIPISFEYAEAYRRCMGNERNRRAIAMPIHLAFIKYKENVFNKKMVVFHGLNQVPEIKGTEIIVRAMKKFKARHPKEVEIIVKGKLPFQEYMNVIYSANIVIDQSKGYGVGMNTLSSLAMGRIVMGGAEPESLEEFGIEDSPVINILPDEDDILEKLEELFLCREEFQKMGLASRRYVEQYHDSVKIARQYLEVWNLV